MKINGEITFDYDYYYTYMEMQISNDELDCVVESALIEDGWNKVNDNYMSDEVSYSIFQKKVWNHLTD